MTEDNPNYSDGKIHPKLARFYNTIERYVPPSKVALATTLVTFIGTVVALFGILVTALAVAVSMYQLDTARRQLAATDRPWIRITKNMGTFLTVTDSQIEVDAFVTIRNIGKSPAINVKFLSSLVSGRGYNVDEEIGKTCNARVSENEFVESTLFPDEETAGKLPDARIVKLRLTEKRPPHLKTKFAPPGRLDLSEPKEMYRHPISFSLVACIRYNTDNDTSNHYSAVIYDIFPKDDGIPVPKGESKVIAFDLAVNKEYFPDNLEVAMPSNFLSRAN